MIDDFFHPERAAIAKDMLYRYSGSRSEEIQKYVLLTNFSRYLEAFASDRDLQIKEGSVFRSATDVAAGVTMIQFHLGAPTAALVVDLLSVTSPDAVILLGLCGGLHPELEIGEFILPIEAVCNVGVSQHYIPEEDFYSPTSQIQDGLAQTMREMGASFKTGAVFSTDFRFWEFHSVFREKVKKEDVIAIEMECSALFTVGSRMKVPVGALLLVSDLPLRENGIKTSKSQEKVFRDYLAKHLEVGTAAFRNLSIQKK